MYERHSYPHGDSNGIAQRRHIERQPELMLGIYRHIYVYGNGGHVDQQQHGGSHGECYDGLGDCGIGGHSDDHLHGNGNRWMCERHCYPHGDSNGPTECRHFERQPEPVRRINRYIYIYSDGRHMEQ